MSDLSLDPPPYTLPERWADAVIDVRVNVALPIDAPHTSIVEVLAALDSAGYEITRRNKRD